MFESERRDLAWVPRWSIIRVNRRQSVAEHSYFVSCYGLEIARRLDWPKVTSHVMDQGEVRHLLALYLLRHDEGECLSGDLPGPIKRLCGFDDTKLDKLLEARFGPAPTVTADMKAIRRAADLIDECFYLAGEWNSGNQAVLSALENSRKRLTAAVLELPGDQRVLTDLNRELHSRISNEMSGTKNINGFGGI